MFQGRLSLPETLGHVDFYPNGGQHQTGCNDMCVGGIGCIEINLWDLVSGSCSHSRANEYYIESINTYKAGEAFVSQRCDSWKHFEDQKCTAFKMTMGYGLDIKKYDYIDYLSLIPKSLILKSFSE